LFCAVSINFQAIANVVIRLPQFFVFLAVSRTAENIDSIGFVVRICC